MPLVSVVIPCFNQGRYLAEAIESARAQSHAPVEIVVIDDGSTDDTRDVATADPEVRYFYQANAGLAAARNAGLRESRGEYLVFLDADDRLLPDALEAGLACLLEDPGVAFAWGRHRYIREDGSLLAEYPPEDPGPDAYRGFLRGNHIGMHATVMYRREVLRSIGGFDPTLRACEDYEIYLRISRQYPVRRHGTVVAEYRKHGANMSSNIELMLGSALEVLDRQAEYTRGDPGRERALHTGIAFWKRHFAGQLVRQLFSGEHRYPGGTLALRGIMALTRYGPGWTIEAMAAQSSAVVRSIARRLRGAPAVGRVDFGDLRRVTPISHVFGYDRGLPIDRYYIEGFLARNAERVRGRVLEIGDNEYTLRFGESRVIQSDILHVDEGNPRATFIGDLSTADHIPSDAFDCIVLTQTLHLIYDVRAAIATLHRILKPGGVLLATFPGMSQIDAGEWGGSWYWGFTLQSARRLFGEAFPDTALALEAHGNVLATMAFLHGLAVAELRPEELDHQDPQFQLLITVRAVKPGTQA